MCYETSLQESFPYIFKNPAYSSGYNDVSCLYIARYFIFARIGLWDSISSCVGMINPNSCSKVDEQKNIPSKKSRGNI